MSHLSLVPPPADAAPTAAAPPAQRTSAFDDANVVALSFFQAASGICLCRSCSQKRHPAFGQR